MPEKATIPHWRNFLAGRWLEADGLARRDVIDPAYDTVIAQVDDADATIADEAVRAARACVDAGVLSAPHPKERARLLLRIATELRALEGDITYAECHDNGKPLRCARREADSAARIFEYYAGLADKIEGRSIPLGSDYVDYTECLPHGITVHIIPFNYPLTTAARSVAPALAAGNACIVKAPEQSPTSALLLATACQRAGVPAGALSVLCGAGVTLGDALVRHPDINHIVFTGSVATGQRVLTAAARTLTPTVMELGGKSAAVLAPDADLEVALPDIASAIFENAGQICSACSRLLVPRPMVSAVCDWFATFVAAMRIGPGEEDPSMGPVITRAQQQSVEGFLARARRDGASVVAQGDHCRDAPGFFAAPTVLHVPDPNAEIAQREVFGPVLSVLGYDTADDAVRIANGTRYGLVAGVYGRDLEFVHGVARRLQVGQVFVNEWFAGGIETPFGGSGDSGFGREKGIEGLMNYVRTRNTAIRLGTYPPHRAGLHRRPPA